MKFIIAKNLAKPRSSLAGYLVSKWLAKYNKPVEQAAVHLCEIEPHHHVLEVGYGPGVGVKEAFNKVAGGSGSVHGIDISQPMYKLASTNLAEEIKTGKVQLHIAPVEEIPYPEDRFDCIFHCNCYYFWPDIDSGTRELHRVIKPDKKVVSTFNLKRLEKMVRLGVLQWGNIDPERYIRSLERNGFSDVYFKNIKVGEKQMNAIFATAKK